jgi:nucleoside 2-deoxyribosyltransferase
MRIYFAGPLFTLAEQDYNERLANALESICDSLDIILPQKRAAELAGEPDFLDRMFQFCLDEVKKADAVVAMLDGADADSGTCVEIGYAKGLGKKIVGVRTDLRALEDRGLNLMVSNICSELILEPAPDTSIENLAEKIAGALGYNQTG